MNKKLTLTLGVILGLVFATLSVQGATDLVVPQTIYNFGYAPQNAKISHSFELINSGDDSLKITKVVPGCGCTKTPLAKDELAPGEKTTVEIIFSTGKYTGNVSKSTQILTDEDEAPKRVRFKSHIVKRADSTYPLIIMPYKLNISPFGENPSDNIKFTISNVSEQDLDLEMISFPGELLELELPKSIKAGGKVEAELKVKRKALGKNFNKSFTIQVNDSEKSRFTIPVDRGIRKPAKPAKTTAAVPKALKKGNN